MGNTSRFCKDGSDDKLVLVKLLLQENRSQPGRSPVKVATAGHEFWCLCGGPESGNMIARDNPGYPIEWFHFECMGLVDAPSGKQLCTECAVQHFQSYHCSEMLCCKVKFKFLQTEMYYKKTIALLKYILFLIN